VKYAYDTHTTAELVNGQIYGSSENRKLHSIHYDTRLFDNGINMLFVCLNAKRKGVDFIPDAYKKGCRVFLVQREEALPLYDDASYIKVSNVLAALQQLAIHHRKKFNIPVIGITGSFAKTIVKEWLYHCLKNHYNIVRSPKSFNSQMGVAFSVLQMDAEHNLAIFEAGISTVNEMDRLHEMIQPTIGVFTGLGSAHDDGFIDAKEKLNEKSKLFKTSSFVISEKFQFAGVNNRNWNYMKRLDLGSFTEILAEGYGRFRVAMKQEHLLYNLCTVLETLRLLHISPDDVQKCIISLPQVAMRMELIQGKNNNIFINDSYALDGLTEALAFLKEVGKNKKQLAIIGLNENPSEILRLKEKIERDYNDCTFHFISRTTNQPGILSFEEANEILLNTNDSVVLFKGQHGSGISQLIAPHVLRSHPTVLEISSQSLRNNLTLFKKLVQPKTKIMVMVKAAAYGVGAYEMATFLEREGVDYLGVAFPDEGVNLRKAGVKLPIMVMNTPESAFYDIIQYQLEPAIFSIKQLDAFTSELIRSGKSRYPVHIKIETGMNRLGFREEDLSELCEYLSSQPEILVKSIYSHLAESGNSNQDFTREQLRRFNDASCYIARALSYPFDRHICNTDGIINYPEAHFDMVRLGIGLLGYAKLKGLEPSLSLKTKISKVNSLNKGESLGYDRSYITDQFKKIAVLPIGYADGFKRIFGNGKGFVYIGNQKCQVLGNVCMDMCFVDVTDVPSISDESVELIGSNVTIYDWASWAETIPYEIITSLSNRITRIWVDE
jgi:alanine racemase